MHLLNPVAQAIHDELQHVRITGIERVAGAGVVDVIAQIVGVELVVRAIVYAAQRQRRTQLAPLA